MNREQSATGVESAAVDVPTGAESGADSDSGTPPPQPMSRALSAPARTLQDETVQRLHVVMARAPARGLRVEPGTTRFPCVGCGGPALSSQRPGPGHTNGAGLVKGTAPWRTRGLAQEPQPGWQTCRRISSDSSALPAPITTAE